MSAMKCSASNQQSVELYIEELVLHGFAGGDRQLLADAMELELTRLFTAQGLPPTAIQETELRTIDAGEFSVAQGTRAEGIGAQAAGSVYRGLIGGVPAKRG